MRITGSPIFNLGLLGPDGWPVGKATAMLREAASFPGHAVEGLPSATQTSRNRELVRGLILSLGGWWSEHFLRKLGLRRRPWWAWARWVSLPNPRASGVGLPCRTSRDNRRSRGRTVRLGSSLSAACKWSGDEVDRQVPLRARPCPPRIPTSAWMFTFSGSSSKVLTAATEDARHRISILPASRRHRGSGGSGAGSIASVLPEVGGVGVIAQQEVDHSLAIRSGADPRARGSGRRR